MSIFYAERRSRLTHLLQPDMVQPFLGKPHHWKTGRSAEALATCWFEAQGIPPSVTAVLTSAEEWRGATLVQGLFEQQTELDALRGPSQTDLLAICAISSGLGLLAVEGKVDETFADTVAVTLRGASSDSGLPQRVPELCRRLALDLQQAQALRYQLLHRTVAAMIESKRYRTSTAVFVVHSFAPTPQAGHYDDFAAFVAALGLQVPQPNGISEPIDREGVSLRFAWVAEPPAK
jgi:hypothetical protein